MSLAAFAALVLATSMLVMLTVQLRVPFRPLRHWLHDADHVALVGEHPDHGPWRARTADSEWISQQDESMATAASRLRTSHRIRSYCAELVVCPWCTSAWWSLLLVVGYAIHRGDASVAWWWLPVWFAAAFAVVTIRRIEGHE